MGLSGDGPGPALDDPSVEYRGGKFSIIGDRASLSNCICPALAASAASASSRLPSRSSRGGVGVRGGSGTGIPSVIALVHDVRDQKQEHSSDCPISDDVLLWR